MNLFDTTRRGLMGGLAGTAVAGRVARAQPAQPMVVNIVDVAGNLALTQPAFDLYRRNNPRVVGRFVYSKAPAPELPAKIKAQQDAKRVDIDLVLTGTDGLSAGLEQGFVGTLVPGPRGKPAQAVRHPAAGGGQDAGFGAGPGRDRVVLPVRPPAGICAPSV